MPDRLPELISQRRRWLNGSFFAALHSLLNFRQIYASPHSRSQKVIFTLEFIYNAVNLGFSWFSFANFYLAFHFLFDTKGQGVDQIGPFGNGKTSTIVFELLRGCYIFGMITMFITSLGNRPQGSKKMYYAISVMFSIIMVIMLYVAVWAINIQIQNFNTGGKTFLQFVATTPTFRDLVISVMGTYGLYLGASLLHMDPWHIFSSLLQYLLVLPTYNNMFMVYAFCNLHDVSWGTKGSTTDTELKPVVLKTDGSAVEFEIEISTEQEEVDAAWKSYSQRLANYKNFVEPTGDTRDEKTIKEDGTREFRTRVVLSWILTNLILIVLFTNDFALELMFPNKSIGAINPYLTFLFWSVTVLAFIRFVGCSIFSNL